MTRVGKWFAILGALVVAASIGFNIYLLRENSRTSTELTRFGLVREDPVLTATRDTLARERAFGDSLKRVALELRWTAAAAVVDYRKRRDSLLASLVRPDSTVTRRVAADAPGTPADTLPATAVPVPLGSVVVDSAQLTGTLKACDAAVAAAEASARACEVRADSADARAARAERGIMRADSMRKAAVDSAGSAIRTAARRNVWRDVKAAMIGAGVVEGIHLVLQVVGLFR